MKKFDGWPVGVVEEMPTKSHAYYERMVAGMVELNFKVLVAEHEDVLSAGPVAGSVLSRTLLFETFTNACCIDDVATVSSLLAQRRILPHLDPPQARAAGLPELNTLHLAASFEAPQIARALIAAVVDVEAGGESGGDGREEDKGEAEGGEGGEDGEEGEDEDAELDGVLELARNRQSLLTRFLDRKDESGHTALMLAARRGRGKMVHILLQAGAGIAATTRDGCSLLHLAVESRDIDTINHILAAGAVVSHPDELEGNTPLHTAALIGAPTIVEILIAAGADVSARNISGAIPYSLATDPATQSAFQP